MPVQNSDIAKILNKMADLLEIEGANEFRVRAYRNASRTTGNLPYKLSDRVHSDEKLTEISGIGENMAEKIKEIVKTGSLAQLEKLEKETDPEMSSLLKLEGLGPKKVKALNRELGITNQETLKKAAEQGKIREVEGFGEKTEKAILEEIEQEEDQHQRIRLSEAEERAEPLVEYLEAKKGVRKVIVAGSYRRRKETVGDLDILVTCKKGTKVMDHFVGYDDVRKVVSKGKTRSTVVLKTGLHVDLRVVPEVSYGAALHYFTGSKAHNIAVRKMGIKKDLKVNEYGVFKGEKRVAGKTEKEVYRKIKLPYFEPELRENNGELEAAERGDLPDLIRLDDLHGDLHVHTKATDGHADLEEMATAAKERGYDYLGISDHSKKVTMAHGLDADRLAAQIEQIDELNDKLKGFVLLKGIEVDILEDGKLDLPDTILKRLDYVIGSVHYYRKLSARKMTERVIRAMDNPCFNILGHPSGRLINKRAPYEIDMEKVMEAAKERGCFLEINADPERLDLTDDYCRMAKDMGLKLSIATDSHSTASLDFIRYGIDQARRGWLTRKDVINTRTHKRLKKLLKRD